MNPLTNIKNVQKMNERELELGLVGKKSWHDQYKDSAWIFIGGLPYDLTEGDVIAVFSQYGELVNINLVRDGKTGKSRGFCFICYEDQRSTVLAVDNLNGIKLLGRTIRVDHVENYKVPKEHGDEDEVTKKLRMEGIAPKVEEEESDSEEEDYTIPVKKNKKEKKAKKKKKKNKTKKQKSESDSEDSSKIKNKKRREKSHGAKELPNKDLSKYQKQQSSIDRKKESGRDLKDRERSPVRYRDQDRDRDTRLDRDRYRDDRYRDRSPRGRDIPPRQTDRESPRRREQSPPYRRDRERDYSPRPRTRDRSPIRQVREHSPHRRDRSPRDRYSDNYRDRRR
ncbi:RNA-binding motif protein, X-linked 2-like [Saccostrea cucullata]|uniref:RNA-binding motif protein, X-linked 2-like n=1 Tax=Saccostrea cuccullata TaxID=36930 RepID=UPI002ED60BB5